MRDAAVSDEFALVAAACRRPLTPEAAATVRRRAAAPLAWDTVLRIAGRHRVVALVGEGLRAAGAACPAAVQARLARQRRAVARQSLALAHETLRLQRRLDAAGIPVLTLKGAALAQRVYGTIALKHARDIDLLVPPARALEALRLLEADGYALVDPAPALSGPQRSAFVARGYQMELADGRSGARVELHWRLSENPYLTAGIDPFAGVQMVALAGGAVRTLGDADLFAYLCVHGAGHSWFRLKWLADLEALLGHLGDDAVPDLYRYAQAHGAGLCAAQALSLCARLFDRRLTPGLGEDLARDRRTRRLVAIAGEALIGADPAAEPVIDAARQGLALRRRFLLGRGLRFRVAQWALTLTAPADVVRWPLPASLRFLYPLIRLPSWVMRRW
jgi:hypothetical protein